MNLEVRFPFAEGPGFLSHVSVELEDEGTITLGVAKDHGQAYAYARITPEQRWRMSRVLFPEGDPGNADAQP